MVDSGPPSECRNADSFDEKPGLGGLHLLRRREFRRMIALPLGRDRPGSRPTHAGGTPSSFGPMHAEFFGTSRPRVARNREGGRGDVNMSIWTCEVTL